MLHAFEKKIRKTPGRDLDWPGSAGLESPTEGKSAMKVKVTRSSGNVFRDLGFPPNQAEHLRIRSDLLIHLQKIVAARRLKQAQAAKVLGVTQPRISDLLRGRIDLFSTDTLIDMLARFGVHVKLVVRPPRRGLKVA